MAVYNEEGHLREALDSVLAQDEPALEVIVVDDLSTDRTLKLAQTYAERDSRVRALSNVRKGKVSAFNCAFEHSRGAHVILFAGDDIMTPGSVSKRLAAIRDTTANEAVFARLISFSEQRQFDGIEAPKKGVRGNQSGGLCILTRSLAARIFPIPVELPGEDVWLGLVCNNFADRIDYIDDIVLRYRIHGGNSVDRNAAFEKAATSYSRRYYAEQIFLERFGPVLPQEAVRSLQNRRRLEQLRADGRIFGILADANSSWKERVRALRYSRPFFYFAFRQASRLMGRLY